MIFSKFRILLSLTISLLFTLPGFTQQKSFKIVPLGIKGGADESNLSAYLLATTGSDKFICLDAGTIHAGIQKAVENGVFKGSASDVLKNQVKAYLISHGHLDHLSGLIINSPEDSKKNIYALPFVIDVLKDKYFTWKNWANFANEGDQPALNKYTYCALTPGSETAIDSTDLSVQAFPLSHSSPGQSTAFLVRSRDSYILYLGDTGPDEIEKSEQLKLLWQHVSPLIKNKKLKAIFIEVSFPNEQPDKQLFGHLTPNWLMEELNQLSWFTGKKTLKDFPIVITHIKPAGDNEANIKLQLEQVNTLELNLIYPRQGMLMEF